MRKFIILTAEGHTIGPNEDYEVDNLQVLGVVENVKNKDEAVINLLLENEWIIDAKFSADKFIFYELY